MRIGSPASPFKDERAGTAKIVPAPESVADQVETGDLWPAAEKVLKAADLARVKLAAAESCTGGYLSALLTGVTGLSHQFSSGFIVYSDQAKNNLLGIPLDEIRAYGAVSKEIALVMARNARRCANADIAVALSGYTGSVGRRQNGLVHIAAADSLGNEMHREFHFGDVDREKGRKLAAGAALDLLLDVIHYGEAHRF